MKRRICLLVLISVLTAGAFPPPAAAAAEERFPAVRVYEGQFRDVSDSDWYYENIKALYELGLVNGQEDGTFGPEGNMSVAEVVTMAARLRSLYEEGDSEAGPARCGGRFPKMGLIAPAGRAVPVPQPLGSDHCLPAAIAAAEPGRAVPGVFRGPYHCQFPKPLPK